MRRKFDSSTHIAAAGMPDPGVTRCRIGPVDDDFPFHHDKAASLLAAGKHGNEDVEGSCPDLRFQNKWNPMDRRADHAFSKSE
jgi:hypothetical protein